MLDDKVIQKRLIEIFEKQPELNDPKKVIQMVWRYWEVVENEGIELLFISKKQWENWQYRHGSCESIIRAARAARNMGQNELSIKHYKNYKK